MSYESEDQFFIDERNEDESFVRINIHSEKPLLEPPYSQPQPSESNEEKEVSEESESKEGKGKVGKGKGKRKRIDKKEKGENEQKDKKKYLKRKADESIKASMGRPENKIMEGEHLKENKSYNDIVYHFSRFLIFLKFMQDRDQTMLQVEFPSQQQDLMAAAQAIMSQDNFPSFQAVKPSFLLHPNSPHYVLLYQKEHRNKINYSSEDIWCILLAYLKRKALLTNPVYRYLLDYWQDILFLVNHPRGVEGDLIPQDDSQMYGEVEELVYDENRDGNRKSESEGKGKGKKQTISQYNILKGELQEDPTIAAYQIACYLHACTQKYSIAFAQ